VVLVHCAVITAGDNTVVRNARTAAKRRHVRLKVWA
jgi:hypothetical protein